MFIRKYFAPEDDLAGGGGGGGDAGVAPGADVADVPGGTPGEPVSMEDTIRNTFKELSARERDNRGRFSKAQQPAAEAVGDDSGQALEQVPDPDAAAPAAAAIQVNSNPDNLEFTDNSGQKHAVNINEAPMSWRPEAKAEYANLPEWAKREAHKREHDFHNGVQQYKAAATFATQIGAEFKPYEALLRSQQWTPQALTKDFMNSHYRLSTGDAQSKAAELLRVAGLYNVTIQDLQSALANPNLVNTSSAPQAPREVIELQQRLDRIEQERTQSENASIQEQIRSFETDGKHEFFRQVAVEMGALMTAGRAKDMQDAYDKAIWSNPEVRAKLLAKQAEEQRKTAAEKAAAAKKAASVNVAARGKHPSAAPVGSMEDTIRSTYRKINGGG